MLSATYFAILSINVPLQLLVSFILTLLIDDVGEDLKNQLSSTPDEFQIKMHRHVKKKLSCKDFWFKAYKSFKTPQYMFAWPKSLTRKTLKSFP